MTIIGKSLALQIIRKQRLWKTYLVRKMNFGWEEIGEMAEQLEHIRPEKLIDKIDELLGFPLFDPHGDPIPDRRGNMRADVLFPWIRQYLKGLPHHSCQRPQREIHPLYG
ncbi:MAG: hypothetical protein IPN15_07330 [Saprospiraceae bacterium]|nr:hypothetical protein [Candidatus Vicinibacter affinis]